MSRSYTPSEDRQSVSKNGHDQKQDRQLRELHTEMREHIAAEVSHRALVSDRLASISATVDKYLFAGRVAWAFISILGMIVLGYQAHLDGRVDDLETELNQLTSEQSAFEERGTKWGEALDEAVREIRQDIRELRRLIRGR